MNRIAQIFAPALALATAAGCATLLPAPPPELNAELRLADGLAALDDGRYRAAFPDLAWVMSHCDGYQAGRDARLALAALELDPRNPDGRPGTGVTLLAGEVTRPGADPALAPLLETAYLIALSLGAPPAGGDAHAPVALASDPPPPVTAKPRGAPLPPDGPPPAGPATNGPLPIYGCGPRLATPADTVAPVLPTLPGPSLAAMLARAEARGREVTERATVLEAELAALRAQLEATRSELDRVRRTLRP